MIRTVETVTGGATAAYGTDAVAGVVNFILDTDFEGFRANISGGENDAGDNAHYETSFGAGFALGAEDRTHLLISLEKSAQDPIWGEDVLEYDWYKARGLIENTAPGAGQSQDNPFYLAVDRISSSALSTDGILYMPTAAGGTQIFDANGNYSPYVPGSPCNTHGCSTVNGGSGEDSNIPTLTISPDSSRENAFVYVEHEFGEGLNGLRSVHVRRGGVHAEGQPRPVRQSAGERPTTGRSRSTPVTRSCRRHCEVGSRRPACCSAVSAR